MKIPVVAIVGRPNVGKSSLLNCFAQKRVAIVEKTPGVTRDRVSVVIEHDDVTMEMIDTGGIGIVDVADLSEHIDRQISFALQGANCVLFVTDVREGVTTLDREVARRLRPRAAEIPFFLVVNKVDSLRLEEDIGEFYELGLGDPIPVSAKAGQGRYALLDRVAAALWPTGDTDVTPTLHLAVVGRQNVGKSTFVNALAQEERVIVSELPGTTRDAVDVRFEKDGRPFVIIDTAGVQRRKNLKGSIEYYSQARTEQAIRRADVVLFLLDASRDVTRADKKLAEVIGRDHRVCVIVANKWDLVKGHATTQEYADYLQKLLPGLRYAPIVFTTATDSRNIQPAVDLAQHLFKVASRRVSTGELNRVVEAIRDYQRPRVRKSKTPKVYYATQVTTCPPTFVIFVNDPALFPDSYRRYVENAIREALPFEEVPVRLVFRKRESLYHD